MARFLPISLDADNFYFAADKGGGGGGEEDEEDETEEDDDDEKKPKTFTQDQVNKIMAKEKREGKKAGVRSLLAKLEVSDEEELSELLEAGKATKVVKGKKDDDEDDAERERERKRERDRDKEKDKTRAIKARNRLVKAELISAGMPRDDAEDFVDLVKFDDGDHDPDDEAVTAAVDDLKERRPKLFEVPDDDDDDASNGKSQQRRRTPDVRTPRPPKKRSKADPEADAKAALHKRYPNLKSSQAS